jgi:hypothetical protein
MYLWLCVDKCVYYLCEHIDYINMHLLYDNDKIKNWRHFIYFVSQKYSDIAQSKRTMKMRLFVDKALVDIIDLVFNTFLLH